MHALCSWNTKEINAICKDGACDCIPNIRMPETTYFALKADSITPLCSAEL